MWGNVNDALDNKNPVVPASVDIKDLSAEQSDSFDDAKKEADKAQAETKESSETLQGSVVDSATAKQEAKSDSYVTQQETQAWIYLDTYEWYTEVLAQLIYEIDWCIETAKYRTWLNKSWKQTLKTARSKLKQYKDIMKDKKRLIEHEYKAKNRLNRKNPGKAPLEVNISDTEIDELKKYRFQRKQKIEYDIKQWQSWKSSNTAPWPNQSLEQVLRLNRRDIVHNRYDAKLNEALQDTAFLRIIDNNQDASREILQWIANNSLSDSQIVIIQSNMWQLAPYFEQYGMTSQVHRCIQTRGWRYNKSYQNYWNMDLETAYKTGWITGWLNNLLMKAFPNAKPEHVSNFSNIAVAAGWIYAIYKVWKRFFGRNKEWKRNILWKSAILAWAYFVPQLLLWKDWYSLLWEILSWKADFWELWYRASNCLWFMNSSDPEIYTQMAPGLLWMCMFPQNYTVTQVRALQQTFSDQNNRKQRYTNTYNRLNKNNTALANEFKNTFNANQYNEQEWNVFLAKLWITDKTSWGAIIFNEAMKTTDKKTSLELWMKSQWKERKSEFKKDIDNYLKQNWEFNPEDLNKNWFKDNNEAKYTMREIDFTNIEKLNSKVDNLPLNDQQKSELKTALESFYDERTIASKPNPNDFDLKMENGLLILRSNWSHECKIKLDTKEIEWFGPWITFTNLADLLNTADLANKILETQKWKISKDKPPFQYKLERKWICFNDATGLRQDLVNRNKPWMDTRVLSTGRWWATSKIEQLCDKPKEFAEYLSNRREVENKIDVDSTQYPIVESLSKTGIIFTNEQEVQQAEIRLKKVREMRCTANWWPDWYLPFSIEWNILVFSNVDRTKQYFPEHFPEDFPGKFQNLSNFPTLLREKDKFLAFMNDKNKWMRASALNR